MSFSFSSLVRLIVITGVGAIILAVGLSKLDTERPNLRSRVATRYYNFNDYLMKDRDRSPRWVDADTGQVATSSLEDGDVLEAASCAPWVDEKGQHQVAGRWSSRTDMGPMSISTDFGLARYTFPEGRLLDHVSTENIPVGPPCWFPGNRARILFVGGDGELYHYAFEPDEYEKERDPDAKRDEKPTPLKWRCPKPGLGKVFLSDVSWPEDPSLIGYVLVALREQYPGTGPHRSFTATSLWWLKLDVAGTEIVEAGRLLVSDGPDQSGPELEHRFPIVGTLSSGNLAAAYLSEQKEKRGWELRIAPIEFDGDQHVPIVHELKSERLTTGCLASLPFFSSDGNWLNTIVESSKMEGSVVRVSVSHLFRPAP